MAGLNKIQIIGHLGRDPEMRFTPQGTPVTSFSVAVSRQWTDREGGKQDETIWFNVSAWNRLAEICNQYLSKGKQVYIEGRMRAPQAFTDRTGAMRCSLEVTATEMQMLGAKGDSSSYRGGGSDEEYAPGYPSDDEPRGAPASSTSSGGGSTTYTPRNSPQPIREDDGSGEDEIPF